MYLLRAGYCFRAHGTGRMLLLEPLEMYDAERAVRVVAVNDLASTMHANDVTVHDGSAGLACLYSSLAIHCMHASECDCQCQQIVLPCNSSPMRRFSIQ